ncbi:uncharacterized protein LOC117743248 isoform X3 [Cyclopterus lumpus]|uniref:uncharacterized protein LOC117743248 isoform X3 n=1 Tax=Cyclopterus lumpus TaxID=8103 RepID=UPI001485FC47|nr:uncharacterized protein LOC117743248 isoform X3 [Cyclopterus lumpus]
MIGNSSLLAAVLTVVSVMWLSLLSVLCLRCKKKSKVIHEEHQIYNPQMFQRGGSVFAVTRSKTVTRANQITSTAVETQRGFEDFSTGKILMFILMSKTLTPFIHKRFKLNDSATAALEEQSNYENISNATTGSLEHTYVAPLPISIYENEQRPRITDADQTPDVYANMHTSSSSKDDEDDYENSEFLDQVVQEQNDGEPAERNRQPVLPDSATKTVQCSCFGIFYPPKCGV